MEDGTLQRWRDVRPRSILLWMVFVGTVAAVVIEFIQGEASGIVQLAVSYARGHAQGILTRGRQYAQDTSTCTASDDRLHCHPSLTEARRLLPSLATDLSSVVTRAGEVTLLVGHFAISVVTATDAISEGQVIAQGNAELLGEYIIMETMTFMRQITGVNYEYELVRLVVQGTITLLAGFVLVLVAWRYHRQVSVTTIATLTSSFNILHSYTVHPFILIVLDETDR